MISALEAQDLTVARGGRVLFERLSFRVEAGEALALTGPNGAGKTSLLRALAGLLRPAAGTVRYRGAEPDRTSQSLHWLGWQDGLKGQRTAADELRFWARWAGESSPRVAEVLDRFGLAACADLETRRLSAGQRRRLALARLSAPPRPVWLLDEPLAPLDAVWRDRMGELMREHLAGGGLIIAAVHDPLPLSARTLDLGVAA
ncbi:MAG TPA: heme ABC exporter ATP-binding protein CcmA [Caulobacteraceae bacterium]|jgi:heme exporter protein A